MPASRMIVRVLLCLVLLAPLAAAQEGVQQETTSFPAALVTGNRFRELDKDEQLLYLMGALDGLAAGVWVGERDARPAVAGRARPTRADRLASCTDGKPLGQLEAMIRAHLEAHPEEWHYPMSLIALVALREACGFSLEGPEPE